jgi:lysozyme family protein
MPSWAAALLFDAVVQHRPGDATRIFQKALRVKPDGIIGDITVAATHGAKGDVISRYFAERAVFYSDLVRGDRVRAIFIRGWMTRLFNLQAFVLCEISESLEAD